MGAGKPALLHILIFLQRAGPQIGLKRRPALIQRQCVIGIFYLGTDAGIKKADPVTGEFAQQRRRGTKRANGVKHANHTDIRPVVIFILAFSAFIRLCTVILIGLFQFVQRAFFQQTDGINQANKGARSISTAAKTEAVNFITELIVVNEKAIAIEHVFFQPAAKGTTDKFIDTAAGTNPLIVKHHLMHTVRA